MSKCPNCGAKLSCGCQKRATPDGKQACSKCINQLKLEKKINMIK